MYQHFFKRFFDIVCALLAMIVFCWLYAIIAVLVRVKLGSPVLFEQIRPGKKDKSGQEKLFKLYKFRTMTDEKDADGKLLPDEMRLTKFGMWLRSTSLARSIKGTTQVKSSSINAFRHFSKVA